MEKYLISAEGDEPMVVSLWRVKGISSLISSEQ